MNPPNSIKEQRIRKITQLYYSRKDVQKNIFEFSKNREICPRYFEGFGKRPDSFQYLGDVFELVKKGATSFHCSEEIWSDPFKIQTGMNEKQMSELRTGWDLLIDIDSPYIDYSKISAEVITEMLKFHGVKNIGIKFSGSKGFHILIPWKAFPKEINNVKTSNMFPEWPRIITKYIMEKTKKEITQKINNLFYQDKYGAVSRYIKREGGFEEIVKGAGEGKVRVGSSIVDNPDKRDISQKFETIVKKEESWTKEVLPDIILVSPRHLFRMPYSLHEKTALASVVLTQEQIPEFQLIDADPLKAEVRNFMPDSEEGEASELLMQALDWAKENKVGEESVEKATGKYANYKPIKLDNLKDENFPPCVKKILKGVGDGKKRALFILINLFRSVGMDKEELEKRIYDWNKKNEVQLREGYIKSQLSWSYRKKPIMPQNCKEFYQGIGVCVPDDFCGRIKNPVNYIVRKSFKPSNKKNSKKINS